MEVMGVTAFVMSSEKVLRVWEWRRCLKEVTRKVKKEENKKEDEEEGEQE